MSKQLIFNLLLTFAFVSASIPPNLTLSAAISSNGTFDRLEMRALGSIANSHPELADYEVVDIYDDSAPNGTESDYFVTLRNGGSAILAAVSFHEELSNFFVSFTRLPNSNSSETMAGNNSIEDSERNDTNWTTNPPPSPPQNAPTPPQNSPTSPNNQTGARILGGYQLLPSIADPKFKIAQSYLLKLHPNLINYKLQYVEYQVVTGINYLLSYTGLDKYTNLTAKVYIDLNGIPRLTAFKVTCAAISPECNSKIAGNIFHGTEQVLITHPQLQTYGLVAINLESHTQNALTFMATFQNERLKMRAIAELRVSKSTEVLSFYSYLYS